MKQYDITLQNQKNICMNDCQITDCFACKKCSYRVRGEGEYFVKYFHSQEVMVDDSLETMELVLKVFDDVILNRLNFISYMRDSGSNYSLADKQGVILRPQNADFDALYQDIEMRVQDNWEFILNQESKEDGVQKKIGTRM